MGWLRQSLQMIQGSVWGRRLSAAAAWLAALGGLVIVAGPLVAIIAAAGDGDNWVGRSVVQLLVPTGRRLTVLVNSSGLALASAGAGILLSWVIGSFLWQLTRRNPVLLTYAAVFVWFMALLPPFIHSYTWLAVFGQVNQMASALGLGEARFTGLAASWWTQTMAWLPLCLSVVLVGFRSIDPALIDAALVQAPPLRVLRAVITPLLAPALLAGGALVFLLCLQEYSVPSLFQISTYALEIFSDYSAYHQPARALMLSIPMMVISAIALLIALPYLRHVSIVAPRWGREQRSSFVLPSWFRWLQYGCLLLLLLQMLLPVLVLVQTAGAWGKIAASVAAAGREIAYSCRIALASAAMAMVIALVVGDRLAAAWHNGLVLLTAATLCMPATLTGIGMAVLYSDSLLSGLYGTDFMPVAAAVARFGPLAWLISAAQQRRQDKRLIEAAYFYPVSPWQRWRHIKLPLQLPGLIAAGMTVFLLTLGELSATLLVLPPGYNSLAVKTYNLLHYGASDAVAGLCLFIVVTGWLAGLAAVTFLMKRG